MTKSKTIKSNKKSKDPKAPKRYRSAYILFSIDKRYQIKNENPELSPKEILSELGALWKSADLQTKEYFQKLSDNEKAEYGQKLNDYQNEKTAKKENSQKNKSISSQDKNQSMEVNSSQ
ncbi:unnamed protein product [Rotaria sordida]|uniref:HMG box domain-containing protein n=1 Tax=Rotaria sordida TaxID=392033 RepID=A0A814K1D5_9BILA|nr:unnamed protein product [Rotaria sordida]CAF1045366.1 unnamed protein product [Rotaria sordida]CAF1057913.1 unnamed protein product [Rotaria sordida]CAF1061371.1 unnamed protein product [Rotaria sordida]CAF1068720.1 unnamed protein product [Rotaria sordida]